MTSRAPADRVVLTLLYAPADRPERVVKALASDADVVIVDLEDAVAPDRKEAARASVAELLAGTGDRLVQLRINAEGSPWFGADLALVSSLPTGVGVRIPKVGDPSDVHRVAEVAEGRALHPLIETAAGVEAAYDIARADPLVATLGLGEADLCSDLGVSSDSGLAFARSRIVNAARAAGLPAPAMSVHTNVRDDDALARSCAVGRELGFLGRAAIHPRQLPGIVSAFTPTAAELTRARLVVDSLRDAEELGDGTVVLADGTFLDRAMVERARRTLAVANRP